MSTAALARATTGEPLYFVEQSVRRNQRSISHDGPTFLARAVSGAVFDVQFAQARRETKPVVPKPPKVVEEFFTQFDIWVKEGATVAELERESYFYLPSILTWLEQIDLAPFEQLIQRELASDLASDHTLWKAWLESEEHIVETDQYVAHRFGGTPPAAPDETRIQIQELWLRRYFLQVLVRKQIHGQIDLPETEQKYMAERLWATAHAAAGLIYGLLPEPSDVPLFESASDVAAAPLADEDKQWLEDSADDPVL